MQRTANLAGYQKKMQCTSFFCLRLNAQNIRLFWQNGYEQCKWGN